MDVNNRHVFVLYKFIVTVILWASADAFIQKINPSIQPLRIVNSYSDSVDLEWDYRMNYTEYIVTVINPHGKIEEQRTKVNQVTLRNMKPGKLYVAGLFGVDSGNCVRIHSPKFFKEMKISLSPVLLKFKLNGNNPREIINDFNYTITRQSHGKIMVTLTWTPVPDAITYRIQYRRLEDCKPNERVIFTNKTKLTEHVLNENDIQTHGASSFVFTLRVSSRKQNGTKLLSYSRAQPIEVKINDRLKEIKGNADDLDDGMNSIVANLPLVIGVSLTIFCIFGLVGCFCYENKHGGFDIDLLKNVFRKLASCQSNKVTQQEPHETQEQQLDEHANARFNSGEHTQNAGRFTHSRISIENIYM